MNLFYLSAQFLVFICLSTDSERYHGQPPCQTIGVQMRPNPNSPRKSPKPALPSHPQHGKFSSYTSHLPLFLFKLLNSLIMFGGNSDLTGIELGGFMFGKGKEKGMCNNVQRK